MKAAPSLTILPYASRCSARVVAASQNCWVVCRAVRSAEIRQLFAEQFLQLSARGIRRCGSCAFPRTRHWLVVIAEVRCFLVADFLDRGFAALLWLARIEFPAQLAGMQVRRAFTAAFLPPERKRQIR